MTGASLAQSPQHTMAPARAGGAHSRSQTAPPNPNGTWNMTLIEGQTVYTDTETITDFQLVGNAWKLNWHYSGYVYSSTVTCIGATTITGTRMKAQVTCLLGNSGKFSIASTGTTDANYTWCIGTSIASASDVVLSVMAFTAFRVSSAPARGVSAAPPFLPALAALTGGNAPRR